MGVTFRVLGTVEASMDGMPLPIPSGKLSTLLAGLLVRANRTVPVEQLTRWLWDGDEPDPHRAKATVQEYVRRLRRTLGSDELVRTAPGGYLITADDDSLDLLHFRTLAARGRSAEEAGELSAAADRLTAALSLWRGPALANISSRALHDDETIHLAEQHLLISEQWAETMLATGAHERAIPELRKLTRANPLRERLWESLIVAVYRASGPAEALTSYEQLRTTLAETLGVDPSPALRQLHRAMLTNDPALDPPRVTPPTEPPHQLPADIKHFTGRVRDLERLVGLAGTPDDRTVAVAAIEGSAGVGKTTLAVHFAHEIAGSFPDGQLFVNLRGYGPDEPVSASSALATMLHAIGVPSDQLPTEVDARVSEWRSRTAGRRLLVVLDNARNTDQVRPLLPGPGCLAIITSRTQLRGLVAREGALRLTLHLLDPSEAHALLASIIGTGRAALEPVAAAQIVDACARLPLAIRILGERISRQPDTPLAEILNELADEQDRLTIFNLDDDEETNLRAVFSRSYRTVDPAAVTLFRLLGALPLVDFTAGAAAAAAGLTTRRTKDLLDRLTAAHLLEEHQSQRYQFHDLMREFAREEANQRDDAQQVDEGSRRLLDWYLHTALNADRRLAPYRGHSLAGEPPSDVTPAEFSDFSQAMDWCDSELANLTALTRGAWARDQLWHVSRIPWALSHFFALKIHSADRIAMHNLALSASRKANDSLAEAHTLNNLGIAYAHLKDHDAAARFFTAALGIWRELDDEVGQHMMLNNLALTYERLGAYDDAVSYGELAVRTARAVQSKPREGISLCNVAKAYLGVGRVTEALTSAQDALTILHDFGERTEEALALRAIAQAHARAGRYELAEQHYSRALELSRELDVRYGESQALIEYGDFLATQAAHERARTCWQHAFAILVELRLPEADEVLDRLAWPGTGLGGAVHPS